jgi:hypothetical protein
MWYGASDYTKFPASGIATVSEPSLVSEVGRVRVVQCLSVIGVAEVPIFLRTLSCSMRHKYP